jgi:hypothetical protein
VTGVAGAPALPDPGGPRRGGGFMVRGLTMTASHRPLARSTGATRLALAVVAAAALLGCDKAKPSYEECLRLEGQWDFIKARDACEAAVKADPNSKSGKAAQNKLLTLRGRADKAIHDTTIQPCKSHKYVTRCVWKGVPRPNLLEEETLAACNQSSASVASIDMVCPACVCSDDYKEPEKAE